MTDTVTTALSDWIEHDGLTMPIDGDEFVEIKCKMDGVPFDREGSDQAGWFDHLDWWDGKNPGHVVITHYRTVSKAITEAEEVER